MNRRSVLGATVILGLSISSSSYALLVTPNTNATDLIDALLAGGGAGIDVTSVTATLSGQDGATPSTGTYTNASGTYGIGPGIVISSGAASDYSDGPNTSTGNTTAFGASATAAQEALLDPITGGGFDHFDVTQLDVSFDMLPGFGDVFFNVVFGSEEFNEFVGSSFIDGFGLYVNGTNIASVDGLPVNINHPDFGFETGTELDGILGGADDGFGPLVHTFSAPVNPTGNLLTFIIADTSDTILDSTAYISQLGGSPPPNHNPTPATLALLAVGLAGIAYQRRRQRS
jgi:hypothetical protein